jgi:hypothetical protein
VFVAAGRRRVVCELCAPRAVHEGWQRESDQQLLSLPPVRTRRGRSFFERLRLLAWPALEAETPARGSEEMEAQGEEAAPLHAAAEEQGGAISSARHLAARRERAPDGAASECERAVEIFNDSEFPRRVAGVARSLGAPQVSVRSAEHAASVVRIVVGWELCWYRYEVDLDGLDAAVRVAAQGTELTELAREEREPNASADEAGLLVLSGA